jgi:hypothetical protein
MNGLLSAAAQERNGRALLEHKVTARNCIAVDKKNIDCPGKYMYKTPEIESPQADLKQERML